MTTTVDIPVATAAIVDICRRYGVRWLAVFGSVARGEAHAKSDVDFLYELRPDAALGYVGLGMMADELASLFGFSWADMTRPELLAPHVRDSVRRDARVLYAE